MSIENVLPSKIIGLEQSVNKDFVQSERFVTPAERLNDFKEIAEKFLPKKAKIFAFFFEKNTKENSRGVTEHGAIFGILDNTLKKNHDLKKFKDEDLPVASLKIEEKFLEGDNNINYEYCLTFYPNERHYGQYFMPFHRFIISSHFTKVLSCPCFEVPKQNGLISDETIEWLKDVHPMISNEPFDANPLKIISLT